MTSYNNFFCFSRFKAQDKKGMSDTLGAISPQELLQLLNSKDHANVFEQQNEAVFNSEQLEQLLDRSDLVRDSNDKENKKGKAKKDSRKSDSSVFKVVDIDTSGGMGSFLWSSQESVHTNKQTNKQTSMIYEWHEKIIFRGSYVVVSGNDYNWKANEENKPFYCMSYCWSFFYWGLDGG